MTLTEKAEMFDKLCDYIDSMSEQEMSKIVKEWINKNLGECWAK